jgi:aquaporin Z
MNAKDFFLYFLTQTLGALAAAAVLRCIWSLGGLADATNDTIGSNSLNGVGGSWLAGLVVELLLTFIFVMVILGVTDPEYKHGSFGGVVIGFSLVMVHLFGIGLTGTSVNPARSIGPAVLAGFDSLSCLWVFIVGPFLGAALAAFIYKFLAKKKA